MWFDCTWEVNPVKSQELDPKLHRGSLAFEHAVRCDDIGGFPLNPCVSRWTCVHEGPFVRTEDKQTADDTSPNVVVALAAP